MEIMFLILTIIATAVLWGMADLLRKVASNGSNINFLSFIFNLGAFIAPLLVLIYLVLKNQNIKTDFSSSVLAFVGGVLAGIGGILLFYMLSKNNVSIIFPSVRVVSLIVVAVGGIMFFKEPATLKLIVGLMLSFVSIYLLLVK